MHGINPKDYQALLTSAVIQLAHQFHTSKSNRLHDSMKERMGEQMNEEVNGT